MSSAWAAKEREQIQTNVLNNTGATGQSPQYQEFCISLLDELIQGSLIQNSTVNDIVNQILKSGQSPEDAWYHFFNLVFSAAMSTSSDTSHEHLVGLMFALANQSTSRSTTIFGHDGGETSGLEGGLTSFGWTARDLWNGEHDDI
jgi:hypothetical protein